MIQLLFVRIRFSVGLANTFRNNFGKALLVARILAVLALHTRGIFQKVSTQRTSHNVVELLRYKLVSVLLLNLFFPLAYSTFAVQTQVEWPSIFDIFC